MPNAAPIIPIPLARFSARRHVADVRLRGRDVPAGEAVDHAREVDQRQPERLARPVAGHRDAEQDEPGDRAELRHDQHRPAADAVADQPEHRRADELADRVDGKQQPDLERADVVLLRPQRQQRDDDAEAEQVGEDDQEDRAAPPWAARFERLDRGSSRLRDGRVPSCRDDAVIGRRRRRLRTRVTRAATSRSRRGHEAVRGLRSAPSLDEPPDRVQHQRPRQHEADADDDQLQAPHQPLDARRQPAADRGEDAALGGDQRVGVAEGDVDRARASGPGGTWRFLLASIARTTPSSLARRTISPLLSSGTSTATFATPRPSRSFDRFDRRRVRPPRSPRSAATPSRLRRRSARRRASSSRAAGACRPGSERQRQPHLAVERVLRVGRARDVAADDLPGVGERLLDRRQRGCASRRAPASRSTFCRSFSLSCDGRTRAPPAARGDGQESSPAPAPTSAAASWIVVVSRGGTAAVDDQRHAEPALRRRDVLPSGFSVTVSFITSPAARRSLVTASASAAGTSNAIVPVVCSGFWRFEVGRDDPPARLGRRDRGSPGTPPRRRRPRGSSAVVCRGATLARL